jgi:hypothetical protein
MHISQIFIPSLASTAEAFLKYAPKNLLTDSHERHQQQPNRVPRTHVFKHSMDASVDCKSSACVDTQLSSGRRHSSEFARRYNPANHPRGIRRSSHKNRYKQPIWEASTPTGSCARRSVGARSPDRCKTRQECDVRGRGIRDHPAGRKSH